MYLIKFKSVDTEFNTNVIFASTASVKAPHEFISQAERAVMTIEFSATEDFEKLVQIYNNEDALSEITITDMETSEIYTHINYVIPISFGLVNYTDDTNTENGPNRWVMQIAQLNDADKEFRKIVGIAASSYAYMTIEQYQDEKIRVSKENLEKFLEKNPLISACKDGIYKEYTVSTDKQNQFGMQYLVHYASKLNNMEDIFSWNEKGMPCEPWTDAECIVWMRDAKAYTKPLIAAQQLYEVQVRKYTSKAKLEKFDIDYSQVKTVNGKPEWIGRTIDEAKKMDRGAYNS